MHRHRTWSAIDTGTWIAGLSGVGSENRLFYLMQVDRVESSFVRLWASLPAAIRNAKSATRHAFGDAYEPRLRTTDEFDPLSYRLPHVNHVHRRDGSWRRDVSYSTEKGKHAHLLVSNPEQSYLWSTPTIRYVGSRHPRFRFYTLREFLTKLV